MKPTMISSPKRVSVTFDVTTEQLHKATGIALQRGCTALDVFREIAERGLEEIEIESPSQPQAQPTPAEPRLVDRVREEGGR